MELTLDVVASVPIFTGMNERSLHLLCERMVQKEYLGGSLIVREGESDNRLFIILSGWVRVCKFLGTPRETELATLGEGEFFGEMCILDTLPRSASVQAVNDSTVVSLSSLAFWELHETAPSEYGLVLLNMARDLSRRLRHLDESFAARS